MYGYLPQPLFSHRQQPHKTNVVYTHDQQLSALKMLTFAEITELMTFPDN